MFADDGLFALGPGKLPVRLSFSGVLPSGPGSADNFGPGVGIGIMNHERSGCVGSVGTVGVSLAILILYKLVLEGLQVRELGGRVRCTLMQGPGTGWPPFANSTSPFPEP